MKMRRKHYQKKHKKFFGKIAISVIVMTVIIISSVVTVMANTIPCTVIDGDKSYSFTLISPEKGDIIEKAIEHGMPKLMDTDKVILDGSKGQVAVERAIVVSIMIANEYTSAFVYKGDTVGTALEAVGIELFENDKIEPDVDHVIDTQLDIEIKRYAPVTVSADGETQRAVMHNGLVSDALNELDITLDEGDVVTPELTTPLVKGMSIRVSRMNEVEIIDAGESKVHKTMAPTVKIALRELGYKLGKEDALSVPASTRLSDDMEIEIDRGNYENITKTETIEFETIYKDDDTLNSDYSVVETKGHNGEKEVVYRVFLVNGEQQEKILQSEKVITEPVDEVILRGTKKVPEVEEVPVKPETEEPKDEPTEEPKDEPTEEPSTENELLENTFVDSNGNTVSYSSVMNGECTAYSDPGGITSLGGATQVGVVAVNPDVIPYGTKLYITSGSVVYGYCIAGDTGGAALNNVILVDVYYDTKAECTNFGRRDMTVYIL